MPAPKTFTQATAEHPSHDRRRRRRTSIETSHSRARAGQVGVVVSKATLLDEVVFVLEEVQERGNQGRDVLNPHEHFIDLADEPGRANQLVPDVITDSD